MSKNQLIAMTNIACGCMVWRGCVTYSIVILWCIFSEFKIKYSTKYIHFIFYCIIHVISPRWKIQWWNVDFIEIYDS